MLAASRPREKEPAAAVEHQIELTPEGLWEEVSGRLSRFYGDHEVVVSQLSTIEPEDYS